MCRYFSAPISRISLTPAATHAIARLRKSRILLLNPINPQVAYPSEMECSIAKSGQWTRVASTEPCPGPGSSEGCVGYALSTGILWVCPGRTIWMNNAKALEFPEMRAEVELLNVLNMTDEQWARLTGVPTYRPKDENV